MFILMKESKFNCFLDKYSVLQQIRIMTRIFEFCIGKKSKLGFRELIEMHKKYNLQD